MGTRGEWATDFAKALGNSSPSAGIVNWIAAWTKGENTEAKFNPLATTWDNGDCTDFNYAGVKNYKSRQAGIDATVKTVLGKHPGYADIVDGIRTNDVNKAAAGLIRAPWGTNGALVQNTAAIADVRNEPLKSESGSATVDTKPKLGKADDTVYAGGTKTEYDSPFGILPTSSTTSEGQRGGTARDLPGSSTSSDTARIGMVLGGSALVLVAIFLIVRTYVPTTQVVKTIAEAAA